MAKKKVAHRKNVSALDQKVPDVVAYAVLITLVIVAVVVVQNLFGTSMGF
jgi:hypothetical protein